MAAYHSLDVSGLEDHSLLPWLDDSSTAHLLHTQADPSDASEDLICFDSPIRPTARPAADPTLAASLSPPASRRLPVIPRVSTPSGADATATPPLPSGSASLTSDRRSPASQPPFFSDSPGRDVETELRATVDALLERKRAAQRGLVDENASLRDEVAFLRNTLRLSAAAPEGGENVAGDSDNAAQLATALEQERTQRLHSEQKLHALVDYLAEQVASLSDRHTAAEAALATSARDCAAWQAKIASAMAHCEILEEENLRVKTLLDLFARQLPATVQQQMQGMLHEIAEERANLKRLEAIERSMEKIVVDGKPESKKAGTLHLQRRGPKMKLLNIPSAAELRSQISQLNI